MVGDNVADGDKFDYVINMTMKDDIDGNRLSDLWHLMMIDDDDSVDGDDDDDDDDDDKWLMIDDWWFMDYDQDQIDYDCVEQDNDDRFEFDVTLTTFIRIFFLGLLIYSW